MVETVAVDTEYDYCRPFLASTTSDKLVSRVYKLRIRSQYEELKRICESPDIRKVFHHASGDIFILKNVGIHVVPPYECTLIASNLVDENYSSKNLKKLAQAHLAIETKESNRLRATIKKYRERARKEGRQFRWSEIPDELILPYAKKDTEYTIKLWYYWQKPLREMRELYIFEKSIIPIIVEMQWRGMRIDRSLCLQRSNEYEIAIDTTYKKMSLWLGKTIGKYSFNPRSPKQLQEIMKRLGLEYEVGRNEKTGTLKTDKKTLQSLLTTEHAEFVKMLLQYRFYTKHKSTYYDPLYHYYTSEKSDVAHFMLYQTGAKTGRFSAELIQTFPRPEENAIVGAKHEVRKVVIPRPGKALLCKDYEQQEMKLFFHYSNCQKMIDLINEKGGRVKDVYEDTGRLLFGSLFDDPKYKKVLRYVTKKNALSGIYGVGVNKLISSTVTDLLERFDVSLITELGINTSWAYNVLQKFYKIYPVREYTQRKISELYRNGYIELVFDSPLMRFRRRYHIPRDKAYKGPNAEIQGTAAYIIKSAMKRCIRRIKREGWVGRVDLLMQVHDELIFEVDNDRNFIKEVNHALTEEMEDWTTFKVPITCSAKWSDKSWGDVSEEGL